MPPITKVQSKKQALAGPMRISPEGTLGTWPGDNPNQCAQGYSCPPPTITIDPFVTFGNRYVDVGAGGPSPFTFTVSANASWLNISPEKGSVSLQDPETRVFFSVDWSQVSDVETAEISFTADTPGQPVSVVTATFVANHTAPPSDFHGRSCSIAQTYFMLNPIDRIRRG